MEEGKATVEVDHNTCVVSGMCASIAPEVFRVADDASAIMVLRRELPPDLIEAARNAEVCCPVEAITVRG